MQVDGTLRLNNDLQQWNITYQGKKGEAIYFVDCERIRITGSGVIDGQGLVWWRLAYLGVDFRPHLITFFQGTSLLTDRCACLLNKHFFLTYLFFFQLKI